MSMKICFKCAVEKPLTEFYKHKKMADGHLNKCKSCTKSDVKSHRNENIDRIREYDRQRGNRQSPEYLKEYRKNNPNKWRAQCMVNNAIRSEKLFPEPCEICGDKAHAHHDDYAKPLNVRWLCAAHHRQWHMENGEGLNG